MALLNDELIRKYTVKISTPQDSGSGFLYAPPSLGEYAYIFTASHCIKGHAFNQSPQLDEIDVVLYSEDDDGYEIDIIDEVSCYDPSTGGYDLTILVCYRSALADVIDNFEEESSKFKVVDYENEELILKNRHLFFEGFPARFKGGLHKIQVKIKETFKKKKLLELTSTENLDEFHNSAYDNLIGFSGSVLIDDSSGYQARIIGVVTDFKGMSTIKAHYFGQYIDMFLKNKGLPVIGKLAKDGDPFKLPIVNPFEEAEFYKPYLNLENRELDINIFPQILGGTSVLVVGPGLCIGDELPFLYQRLISNYLLLHPIEGFEYEDITEFLDIIWGDSSFNRKSFDLRIFEYLKDLELQPYHFIIPTIDWRAIVNTNPDILVENAYSQTGSINNLRNISSKEETSVMPPTKDETLHIKLLGDINDHSKYPLIYSSDDLNSAKKFIDDIKKSLDGLSPKTPIFFVGFSMQDNFARRILELIRPERNIFVVDPYISDIKAKSLARKKINIIKTNTHVFFERYRIWFESYGDTYKKRVGVSFFKRNKKPVSLDQGVFFRLHNIVRQFDGEDTPNVSEIDFLLGKEPTYTVIKNDYDVVKHKAIEDTVKKIQQESDQNSSIPIYLLSGSYGTGKTTFTLRSRLKTP